jgi:hypothetical protein
LLTGAAEGGRPPLSWAILGDKEIRDTGNLMGYGPARVLTAQQVHLVSKAVVRFTQEKLRRGFDLEAMKTAQIYGVKSAKDFEYLWAYFQKLKASYLHAAKRRNGLLCYVD